VELDAFEPWHGRPNTTVATRPVSLAPGMLPIHQLCDAIMLTSAR
jgi:hypothetical protein